METNKKYWICRIEKTRRGDDGFMNENIKFPSTFQKLLCRLSGNDPYQDVNFFGDQPQEDFAKYGCNPNMK